MLEKERRGRERKKESGDGNQERIPDLANDVPNIFKIILGIRGNSKNVLGPY